MTREELHELVDIVMDAREKEIELVLRIDGNLTNLFHHLKNYYLSSGHFDTFSDFTQAVKDYIKSLEG